MYNADKMTMSEGDSVVLICGQLCMEPEDAEIAA